jgi:hypothetical protein
MENCSFSLKHYDELMALIKQSRYRTIFFNEATFSKREIIIRHDIDTNLVRALDLASIENRYGIRSTWFLWLGSPFYNIFEKSHSDVIKAILAMGHQIGLHFNENEHDISRRNDLTYLIKKEADILELAFDTKINAVSFHMPSEAVLKGEYRLGDSYCYAYHDDFFRKYKYISDSSMRWREGCLCKHLEEEDGKPIQVLIHPLWWQESTLTRKNIIDNLIDYKQKKLLSDLEIAAPFYKEDIAHESKEQKYGK